MKQLCLLLFLVGYFLIPCTGQELVPLSDTTNGYQISVPVGWQYGIPVDGSANLMVYRVSTDTTDLASEAIRVNIFYSKETSIEKEYKIFVKTISKRTGFKLIEEYNKGWGEKRYKYLVENHTNENNGEQMLACIMFANDNGRVLMITMATWAVNADKYKPLFDRIADTLVY